MSQEYSKFEGLADLSDGVLRLLEQNIGLTLPEIHEAVNVVLRALHGGGIIKMTSGRIFPIPYLGAVKK
jgi:hypothetical protein